MTARYCGRCFECCVHLALDDRPAHVRCPQLDDCGRCSDYDSRPDICQRFVCAWKAGLIPMDCRPDEVGVIVQIVRNMLGGIGVNVVECRADAVDAQPDLVEFVRRWPGRMVKTDYIDGRIVMYSHDQRWISHLRENNPTLGIKDCEAIELTGVAIAQGTKGAT